MHIKALVLDNFKSFGQKTKIPLYEDFTTISGPNGSGKSNIIDSILFALGLARTSGIRADKLTDLIYNPGHDDDGSGFGGEREASVEVVLDNSDGTLSREQVVSAAGSENVGDIDEITIRRRVKQTDEETYYSYYYLNGRSVNLSDIQDLLAQAGVTPEGYNVVMQGDVTEIITMTPGSRREIIDEIAGVAQFDAKKEDAFEELGTVQERIDEADLRIEEKQQRLSQLEDERETALEYQDLQEEKAEYEGYLKAAELEDKREERSSVRERIEETEATLETKQRTLDERQGRVSRLEDDLEELNAEIERKGEDEQLEIKREIEEIKGDISRLEDKREAERERLEDAENERRQAFVQVDRKQEELDDLEADIRNKKVEKSSIKADIQEKEAELEAVEAEIEAVDSEYEETRDELESHRERVQELKDERNDLQREQDRLLDESRRRTKEERETESALEDAEEKLPELDAERADLENELKKAEANRETITEVVEDLKSEKRRLQDDLEDLEDDISAKQQEYAELEARAGDSGDASYGRAVTTVLNASIDGVHGTVGQLGGVDPEYATACETAAGGRLANVVVDDDSVGQQCIEHLKSRNAGRATFLPMTEMHNRSLPSTPDLPGVVDFAYNLIDFDSRYAEVFSYVVGDTLVVEDMATARDLMGEFRLVTLDGDLVEKSGAMTGGSKSGSRYSFSKRGKGQLERVAERITELEDEKQSLREELRDVESRLDDARDRQTDAAEQVRDIEADIEAIEEKRGEVEGRIEELEAELEELEAEREQVAEEMSDVEAEIEAKDDEIEAVEDDIEELAARIENSEIPELTSEAEAIREDIAELEARADDIDGDLNELQLEKQYAEEAIDELHDDIETAQNRKADAEAEIETLDAQIESKETTLAEKKEAVTELEDELASLKDDREALKADLKAAKSKRDEAEAAVSSVKSKLESLTETEERLEWEIEELEAEVDEYDPESIPDHDTVETRITELEAEMSALEPVNMLAIDEYDEVEADLDELEAKRATLAEEADQIRDRIDAYEDRKRETFMDAYESINEQFADIFSRLSGGSGELVLEDPEDPFEGGLTMKAQPGDKPVQRLDAMSGGEKSLTALAFIFAIQRHNPAPFYALDEVDAFLDAANAEMVGEMVEELAGDAQFVVVSHRSALLERSERAIGVTMQENNVSAVTGIDLSEMGVPADD
ncbi:chromosome segregation protein Smc [Natronomonas pharaonis DSM 2160]|uniref:Chromosome partition protein Smc n=1 Tax=Natronomonas pharaonis (strain ATCC 35678 / DSM 2160 / CIP 103997 / JCM 8858 / NBRC 14720 / NCIMB 2260 / Gabara) TaxID=348780 RepID=A0A1U7EUN2_NATPD|nr:chromosome segregation protein SMC [Natronomonas pharaonis]CAI48699.1 chromosome segregation protein Smc [Natronomonas pharaonis DSM 2160]